MRLACAKLRAELTETTESGSTVQTSIEFELSGSEGYALTSGVIYFEPCGFDEKGYSEVLVLTPWAIDCRGPKISSAPDNWKALTITLEDGCGYDPSLKTAEQSVAIQEDGVKETSYSHGHSHDFSITNEQRTGRDNGIELVSLEIDIFEKFQGQGSDVIGTLKAADVRHCGLQADDDGKGWWQP